MPPPAPTPAPGFTPHEVERTWDVPLPREQVWAWLCDPDTFIKGQIWPWFVEFLDGGFETGVRNTHTGPLLHCCGVIGEVRAPAYRDLVYNYGAYVLRMAWIRPTRLQFWLDSVDANHTQVRMRLESHCKPWIRGLWSLGNRLFWSGFGRTLRVGPSKRAQRLGSQVGTA